MGLATGYRGNPRVSTASATVWPWHVPLFCPWQPPWDPPWQPTEVPRQLPRHIPWPPPRQLPRQSTAINGEWHGVPRQLPRQVTWQYAAITTVVQGNCHGNFHGRQSIAISTENHDIPRPSVGISTAISALHKRQFTAIYGNFHKRQSTAIATANHDIPRRLPRQFTRQLPR